MLKGIKQLNKLDVTTGIEEMEGAAMQLMVVYKRLVLNTDIDITYVGNIVFYM